MDKVGTVTRAQLLSELDELAEDFANCGAMEALGRLAIGEWAGSDFAERAESIRVILRYGWKSIGVVEADDVRSELAKVVGDLGDVVLEVIRDIDGTSAWVVVRTDADVDTVQRALAGFLSGDYWSALSSKWPHVLVNGCYLPVGITTRFV